MQCPSAIKCQPNKITNRGLNRLRNQVIFKVYLTPGPFATAAFGGDSQSDFIILFYLKWELQVVHMLLRGL